MREDDFEEELDDELLEEYCDDPSNDYDIENEEEYIAMLAENGEGLLMGEEDEEPLLDEDIFS